MTIFKKIMLLIATLSVAMLPFGFSYFSNTSQSWIDIFGEGEAFLLGVVFAADVLGRCFVQTKDRPSRMIIGLLAGLVCLAELPFYGKASTAAKGWTRSMYRVASSNDNVPVKASYKSMFGFTTTVKTEWRASRKTLDSFPSITEEKGETSRSLQWLLSALLACKRTR